MSGKRTRSFKCAVHQRDREVCSENDFHLVLEEPPIFERMVHCIAMEVLTDERDRKYYADRYRCWPPPFFMLFVTLLELACFVYQACDAGTPDMIGPVPIDSLFIYRPDKRAEVWRFVFYMVLHAGWFHLSFNVIVQLLFGLPLEMVHGSLRIACIYFSGVLAGSLATSIFDPEVFLVGASGGVYALLAAHLANVLLNYHEMRYGLTRFMCILIFASCDFGFAIYARYAAAQDNEKLDVYITQYNTIAISYVSHLAGAISGLTLGLLVLKNFEQKLREQLLWWIALGVYSACALFGVVFNIFNGFEPIRVTETIYANFQI